MKYYCRNCGSEITFGTLPDTSFDFPGQLFCPCCNKPRALVPIPDYETLAQYKTRTGKPYYDRGLVWAYNKISKQWDGGTLEGITKAIKRNWPDIYISIVIASPPVPPPDDFVPEEPNPFKGKSDERNCRCNDCEAKFREGDIVIKGSEEFCPKCGKSGCIADEEELYEGN